MSKTGRRDFIKKTGTYSTAALLAPALVYSCKNDISQMDKWRTMMKDPAYDMIKGPLNPDQMYSWFPRPFGDPAFDASVIRENLKKLKTIPEINTGVPYLDLAIKIGLAHIDATFQGDHPRYGAGRYAQVDGDTFPPVIIAAVDALTLWGLNERAAQLFNYWLTHFVKGDGTIDYYGTAISEYGQLLHTAMILFERAGGAGWLDEGFSKLDLMAEYLMRLAATASANDGLIAGVPEADTRDVLAKYFHNNAWVVKGFEQWADLCEKTKKKPAAYIKEFRNTVEKLKVNTLSAIRKTWPADVNDWWLPAKTGDNPHPRSLTDGNEAGYANYRYWPELLSSGILPEDMANRLVNARLNGGGQFCGMTRIWDHLDDWPLADYLYALWSLGRKNDFLLSLYGHILYHQCEGHLTAYEQISFPGDPKGLKKADYCLPCQLVAVRAGRLINKT